MPAKRAAKRPRLSSAFVLVGVFYDVGNRRGNVRLIVEGPFKNFSDATAILTAMAKDGLYSTANTRVIRMRNAACFYKSLDEIRALLKS